MWIVSVACEERAQGVLRRESIAKRIAPYGNWCNALRLLTPYTGVAAGTKLS